MRNEREALLQDLPKGLMRLSNFWGMKLIDLQALDGVVEKEAQWKDFHSAMEVFGLS